MYRFIKYIVLVAVVFNSFEVLAQCDTVCKNSNMKKRFWTVGAVDVTEYEWLAPPTGSNIVQDPSTGVMKDTGFYNFTATPPGNYAITLRVKNSCGSVDKSFNIAVVPMCNNRNPKANDDTIAVKKGNPKIINVLLNDKDPDGDSLKIVDLSNPKNGTAVVINGKVVYTPKPTFTGKDTFFYIVSDGKGGLDTAFVYLNIKDYTILAINDRAIAYNSDVTGQVKANDIFPSDSTIRKYTRIIAKQSSDNSGTFTLNLDGTYTYSTVKGNDELDSVRYELCIIADDGDTLCSYAWVYLENFDEPFIPDLVTPNGDGNNDNLFIRNLDKWRNTGMLVYNRMGDLVWTRNPYDNADPFIGIGMDAEELPGGTYYYIFKYKVLNNGTDEIRNKAGFIEIYR